MRKVMVGVVLVGLLLMPVSVAGQTQLTTLCVVVAGDPPAGAWGAGSLSAAIGSGAATIEQVSAGGDCALTPSPTPRPGQVFQGAAGESSDPFSLTAGDHDLFWSAFENSGEGCTFSVSVVTPDGTGLTGGSIEAELGPGTMSSALVHLEDVAADRYYIDGSDSTCSWVISVT